MTQHVEQTGETEVEPELEQAKRKLSGGQIHRNGLEQSFVCGFEGMSNIFYGPVAQLVRAPPCHGGGRRFEPDPGRLI